MVIPKVNFFKKIRARPLNKNFTRATGAEHTLGDKLVGAVDKDKGLFSVQSAFFFFNF